MSDQTDRPAQGAEQDLALGSEAGISPEDRREVVERIEAVVRENRIQVTPDLLAVAAGRPTGRFPLVVNLAALLVLAGALAAGVLAFRRGQADMAGAHGTFRTAEGRVIAELRRQADEQLRAKDGEIRSIQERLASVGRERDQILAEIDERVRQKEEELRRNLLAEMEAERQRLLAAGQSRETVDALIRDLQSRRSEEILREVEDYRRQLEQEWERQLAGLRLVQSQYQAALAALERERLAISREAQEREQALRREAAAREQAQAAAAAGRPGQAAQTGTAAGAGPAEQELAAAQQAREALETLGEQARQEALVRSQILGLYGRIADDLGEGRYEAASQGLASLRSLYADPRFLALPGVRERMKVDLFLAEALERLIEEQRRGRQPDLAALSGAAAAIGRLEERAAAARALAESGQAEEAALRYREALEGLPPAAEAHAFFLRRQQQAQARQLEEAGTEAQRRTEALLAESRQEAAALRGRLAEMERTLAAQSAEARRLAPFELRERALRQGYQAYAAEEDRLLREQGDRGLAAAKLAFDGFLTSEPAASLMPGFWNRTRRYEEAFEREGRQNAALEMVDLVFNLCSARDRAAKLAFLDGEARRYAGDEFTLQLIEEMRALVAEQ